ncbi:MAG TPA: hypothetical protein PKH31_00865, partial [Candidatus Sumerlaeota bacterium]|nr:hypothetical protein [Candidatus Sumerlaeota bacterium]
MDTNILPFQNKPIGAVFTPIAWARFAIHRHGFLKEWIDGASICDPTAGDGSFVFALCDECIESGIPLTPERIGRIFVCEKETSFLETFRAQFLARYGILFPDKNIYLCDVLLDPPNIQVDFLFGNPPWVNFSDMPSVYKERLKSYFIEANLVTDPRSLLLGSSRIDLAALVVVQTMTHLLKHGGKAAFFLPLSLFQNPGSHARFREFLLQGNAHYELLEILDFDKADVFEGI